MANTVTTQLVNDGPRNVVAHINIEADGSGDETDFPVIDPTLLTPVCDHFSVRSIQGTITGEFGVKLAFGGTSPVTIVNVQVPTVANQTDQIDFDFFAGLPDPQSPNYTGVIELSTDGMTAAGDAAQIHIHMTKHQ